MAQCFVYLLLLLLAVYCSSAAKPKMRGGLENSPLTEVKALEVGRALLPCEVTPPIPNDETILVLFYRGSHSTPIYSIDGRNGPVRTAQHWTDKDVLGGRAYFDLSSRPPGLVLNPLKPSDQGEYRCRVDFRSSPTRNVRVNLKVVVLPKKIRVVSEAGLEVSGVIGPYPVGSSVTLHCKVENGRPTPKVTWWNEASMLDDVSEEQRSDVTVNTLTLPPLTRNDLYRVLTCKASNSNLSVPLAAAVTIDMSFPPLDVRILGSTDGPFSEGSQYKIVCESSGSRPTATITWWKDGMLMTDARSQVFQEGNVSRSTLHLTPTLADHDAYISCRAKNPRVPTAVMEDATKLNVYYTPRLSLAAGTSLDMDDIKEGDDVYFECGIQANPSIYKVQWFHNGEEIGHNVSAGVIQSNQSLVLQRLTKTSSGQYTCSASNIQGTAGSNAVQLSVKFSPLCRPGQTLVFGAGKNEELNITCSVEAHPEPTSFRWAFNSSSEVVEIPSSKMRSVGQGRSQVTYTPKRHQDYGSLLCWATNDVGVQRQPCIYHIIHASPPDPVNNCTVENISSTGVGVRCQAGWDGGLAQTFTLSVSHARAHTRGHDNKKAAPRVLANTSTSPRPEFSLVGLEPGTEYVLTIMGVNKKGQSEAVRLAIFTLKDVAEKHISPVGSALALTSLLAMVLGVLASLMAMAVVIAVLVRRSRRLHNPEVKMVYHKGSPSHPDEADDPNPDVIPVNDDHQMQSSQQQQQQQTSQQQQQTPAAVTEVVATAEHQQQRPPSQLDFYGGQLQHHLSKEYLQGNDGSFYINPGTLLRQGGVSSREQEPLSLMGMPLAASTPTATTSPPTLYPRHSPHLSTLSIPHSYTCDVSSGAAPYTHHAPPSYPRDVTFMPITSAYAQDYRPAAEPYTSEAYSSDIPCMPPPYPNYTLSLGRKGRLAGAPAPSCITTSIHHGSAYPLVPQVGGEPLGQPVTSPWEASSDRSVSPTHRESSV
ncbi:protein turtle-like isoform X2 [Homarus americanus]|uniref:protein turtle-like isoform X2 n=1 Tax=Homarus americanus TaxID=6706 RepID=UPI001C459F46|nr:protein turtle-like isoform X2 [Homarus americanus]